MKVELVNETSGELEMVELPGKFEVCRRCRGRGTHDCWEGGMTGDEMSQQSPEFFEDYMAGVYSVQCTVCKSLRVVEIIDRQRTPAALLERHDAAERELSECDALAAAERRFGA